MLRAGLASLAAVSGLFVESAAGANHNPPGSLCLDLRGAAPAAGHGRCRQDADCPQTAGQAALICADDDFDASNDGICVEQACYTPDQAIVVDVELGPTAEPACGAQIYLEWDASALALTGLALDPDSEFDRAGNGGWRQELLKQVNHAAGTIDLAVGLPIGVPCNAVQGTFTGGTIARLTFTSTGPCESFGVRFRPHNPPTKVSGPAGQIPLAGCNGETLPSATDPIAIHGPPVWECPPSSAAPVDCGALTRRVTFPPIYVQDSCDTAVPASDTLCTVTYFPFCSDDASCPGGGNACIAGVCAQPIQPGFDLQPYLQGGGSFLPGRTEIRCAYTNTCGSTAACEADIVNLGADPDCSCAAEAGMDCNHNGVLDSCDLLPPMTATGLSMIKPLTMDQYLRVFETIPDARPVGAITSGFGIYKDVAVDPLTGLIYTIELQSFGGGPQRIYVIHPVTGRGTPLPHTTGLASPHLIWGLAFDANGQLYGGGIGVHTIDKHTGRATTIAGLLDVPAVIHGMAASPLGVGFVSTGYLLSPGGPTPYVGIHGASGRFIQHAVFALFDASGRDRVLMDIAVTSNGLLYGAAWDAHLFEGLRDKTERDPASANGRSSTLEKLTLSATRQAAALRRFIDQPRRSTAAMEHLRTHLVRVALTSPLAAMTEGQPIDTLLLGLGDGLGPAGVDTDQNGRLDDCE